MRSIVPYASGSDVARVISRWLPTEKKRERIATPDFGVAVRFRSVLPHLKNLYLISGGYDERKGGLEASPGIEPGCKDLQSSA